MYKQIYLSKIDLPNSISTQTVALKLQNFLIAPSIYKLTNLQPPFLHGSPIGISWLELALAVSSVLAASDKLFAIVGFILNKGQGNSIKGIDGTTKPLEERILEDCTLRLLIFFSQ